MNIDLNSKRVWQLAGQFMLWDRVEERLRRYPEIRAHFEKPLRKSRQHGHHCHQMAWRLGTWSSDSEEIFQRLEGLLAVAKAQTGWAGEKGMFTSTQYGTFWGLVWQLQVAEWLVRLGFSPKWQKPGPDLRIEVGGRDVWVECYSAVGSHEAVEFLQELFSRVYPNVRVRYDPSKTLPSRIEEMVETCITTVESKLATALEEVRTGAWPVLLYSSPEGGAITVQLDGDDIDRYEPRLERGSTPDLQSRFTKTLRRVFAAKHGKNSLAQKHPNVVMTNLVVHEMFQIAIHQVQLLHPNPRDLVPHGVIADCPDLDAIIWTITGIDEQLKTKVDQCEWRDLAHPLREIVERSSGA